MYEPDLCPLPSDTSRKLTPWEHKVDDILLPPLSVIFPLNRNLDEKFAVLQAGPNYGKQGGYNTLAQAKADGAVILSYGSVTTAAAFSSRALLTSARQHLRRPRHQLPQHRRLPVRPGRHRAVLLARPHHQAHGQVPLLQEASEREGE